MASSCSSSDEEECQFFDAQETIPTPPPLSDPECHSCRSTSPRYDVWIRSPRSIRERRKKFLKWMGLSMDNAARDDNSDGDCRGEIDRITVSSRAVLRNSFLEDGSSSWSSMSSCSIDALDSSDGSNEFFVCRDGNQDGGPECRVADLVENGLVDTSGVKDLNQLWASGTSVSRVMAGQSVKREVNDADGAKVKLMDSVKRRWLSKLRSMACVMGTPVDANNLSESDSNSVRGKRIQRVKVRHHRKRLKELSALYRGQDIQAHEGSILSMKFSPDGRYLASAGEDKIVRIWQVVEDERSNEIDIPEIDPSCIYFTINHLSELNPLILEKEKIIKSHSLRKTADSACVIFPPKVFRILEKPLHVFEGHTGEILDLSWSKDNRLLSSSVDKTVRLWELGCNQCLKVFPHSNYVTCIQFNPMDNDYFISGCIDGKVRTWAVNSCQVIDWADIKDIVTAISYRPDGQGGIIGSMAGVCRFFNYSGNQFQLGEQVNVSSKKKSPCKRITGFQYFPREPSKILVTAADSQIRVISGTNMIGKYRGIRNVGNQISASFTSSGKHIVSASEDSNVYLWNHVNEEEGSLSQHKAIKSFECFSTDASVAISWPGLQRCNGNNGRQLGEAYGSSSSSFPFSTSNWFSLSQKVFLEPIPRGSATWPEEKLPVPSPEAVASPMCKSRYKFFKTSCQSSTSSHAWGLVIVTAGWDGRIRSFHNYGLPVHISDKVIGSLDKWR